MGFLLPDEWPVELQTAVIAATVALITTLAAHPLRFFVDRTLYRGQIRAQYEQGRLKEIHEVTGEHLGPLLEAAEAFDHRMRNMYKGSEHRSWLSVGGNYEAAAYYLDSTVQRFFAVLTVIRRFEVRALHIDPRIVRKGEFSFVAGCKSLRWVLTDAVLFDGLDYDASVERDHFFADHLRAIADEVIGCGARTAPELKAGLAVDSDRWDVWRFFDGISPAEARFRWDRLVCFHVMLLLFLKSHGYPMQRPTREHLQSAISQLQHPEISANLRHWADKLGLDRSDVRLLTPASQGKVSHDPGGPSL